MTTILLTLGVNGTQVVNSPLSRSELEDTLGLLHNDFEILWSSNADNASLRLIAKYNDTTINEYLLSAINCAARETTALPEPIPADPRSMSVIDQEGTGVQGYQNNDGIWHYSAHLKNERIYEFGARVQEDVVHNLEKIRDCIDVLGTLANFADSTCSLFPPAPVEPVEQSVEHPIDLPDLTAPISKKTAQKRLEGLLGTGQPEDVEPPFNNPGTFLMLKEGSTKPMQVILTGDGEVLRDIGFLSLLKKKYDRDIQIGPVDGNIRTVKVKRHLAKRYLEIVRSILLDCKLVQNYEISTDEYVPNNAQYAQYIFL